MFITISDAIRQACPDISLAIIRCDVKNSSFSDGLQKEISDEIAVTKTNYPLDTIKLRPAIAATRQIYKNLGKDPNRYRPSAEALCRRIARDLDLYRVNTLVDIINLVSIRSGFSIGAFDMDKINGEITLDKGINADEFDAIGRGILNVEGLPLYKDKTGGIGTPTSDNERTKITESTTHLLIIINSYHGEEGLHEAIYHTVNLLKKYAEMTHCDVTHIR